MDERRNARWLLGGSWLFAGLAACSFTQGTTGANIGNDAPTRDARRDATAADAVVCTGSSLTCVDDFELQMCDGPGMAAIDIACGWGCMTTGGAHCGVLQPAGGAVPDTLLGTGSGLADLVLSSTATLSTNDGSISGVRGGGTGTQSGIDVEQVDGVTIVYVHSLTVSSGVTITVTGTSALALVADAAIDIEGLLDVSCQGAQQTAGPGGFAGANNQQSATGSGSGTGGSASYTGGGGGGNGGSGGGGSIGNSNVTNAPAGGAAFGNTTIAQLGGGGGGGGGNTGAGGGGGGGAQLDSNLSVTIGMAGAIGAGGCGGQSAGTNDNNTAGGGGGAGGDILIEAPTVTIDGQLAVNGGGGGGFDGSGSSGPLGRTPAAGGGDPGYTGGSGAAGSNANGGPPINVFYGGGGGAIGYIRFNTLTGAVSVGSGAVLSPSFSDATTCTHATAVVR